MARRGGGGTSGAPQGPAAPDVREEPIAPTAPEAPPVPDTTTEGLGPGQLAPSPEPMAPPPGVDQPPTVEEAPRLAPRPPAPPAAEERAPAEPLVVREPLPRGAPLSLDDERRGVQAIFEASLHAEMLERRGETSETIENLTGMRRSEEGFEISNAETIATAAGRGPFFNTVMPELEPIRGLGDGIDRAPATWENDGLPGVLRDLKRQLNTGIEPTPEPIAPSLPISLAALGGGRVEYPPAIRRQFAEVGASLQREFRRMLPNDVGVRLEHRLSLHGYGAAELVQPPHWTYDHWALHVALEPGPAKAKLKGFHGKAAAGR